MERPRSKQAWIKEESSYGLKRNTTGYRYEGGTFEEDDDEARPFDSEATAARALALVHPKKVAEAIARAIREDDSKASREALSAVVQDVLQHEWTRAKRQKGLASDDAAQHRRAFRADWLRLLLYRPEKNRVERHHFWNEWLEMYEHSSLKREATRPLMFVNYAGSTMGDLKPMCILAVLAARSAAQPVHMVLSKEQYARATFLPELARRVLETKTQTWEQRLILHLSEESPESLYDELNESQSFFGIGFSLSSAVFDLTIETGDAGSTVTEGFKGDSPKVARFVSCLLSRYRYRQTHFGSLFLPLNGRWSNRETLATLNAFFERNSGKKVVGVMGSLSPPVHFHQIVEWLKAHSDWAAVCLGFSDLQQQVEGSELESRLLLSNPVEFEDLVGRLNFYIHNCGAGSAVLGLAAGVAQACAFGSTGNDKFANLEQLQQLGAGIFSTIVVHGDVTAILDFAKLMAEFMANASTVSAKARSFAPVVAEESRLTWLNMHKFFHELTRSRKLQEFVVKMGIPAHFGLPRCEPRTPWEQRDFERSGR